MMAVKTGVITDEELQDTEEKLERNRFRARKGAFDGLI